MIVRCAPRCVPLLPSDELEPRAGNVKPLVERVAANLRHNDALAALLNMLLPKLISGEIRVPEA